MKRFSLVAAVVVGMIGMGSSPLHATAPPNIGQPDQSQLDIAQSYGGTWFDLTGGAAARPFVSALSVINAGVSTPIITNGTSATETNVPAGRIVVSIAPENLCRIGQAPAQGVCYASPNRIGVSIGYQVSPGQMAIDFNNNPTLLTPVNQDTEFDLTLNLNTIGKTLRWTWASGIPTYWNTTNLGSDNATLRIRLKPTLSPVVMVGNQSQGCSQVPVQACQYTASTHETLSAKMVLSLDTTLDEVFTGALFSSSRSFMGSLMVQPGETPQMTYGVSAPQTWSDGSANKAQMYAVLSDASILNFYGATSEVAASTDFQTNALNLARTDGGTQGAITWTRWASGTQGTDGWLINIPDITFAAASASAQSVRAMAGSVAPAQFAVKTKATQKVTSRRSGSKSLITVRASASACAKFTCRVVVSSIGSKTASTSTKLGALGMKRKAKAVNLTVATKAAKGQRISTMLQAKKSGTWVFVSSSTATAK